MSWVMVGVTAADLIGGEAAKQKTKKRQLTAQRQQLAIGQPLMNSATSMREGATRQGLTGLQGLAIRSAAQGRGADRTEALGQNSADIAAMAGQNGPATGLNDIMGRAMTRARGLSRLSRHTSDTFDNQLLRERMSLVGGGRQRQGVGLSAILDAAGLRGGTLAAGAASRDIAANTRANTVGTAFGLGIGAMPEIRGWNRQRLDGNIAEDFGGLGGGGTPSGYTSNRA